MSHSTLSRYIVYMLICELAPAPSALPTPTMAAISSLPLTSPALLQPLWPRARPHMHHLSVRLRACVLCVLSYWNVLLDVHMALSLTASSLYPNVTTWPLVSTPPLTLPPLFCFNILQNTSYLLEEHAFTCSCAFWSVSPQPKECFTRAGALCLFLLSHFWLLE